MSIVFAFNLWLLSYSIVHFFSCVGDYIDSMLIIFLGCHRAERRANRQDERIISQSNVDNLGSQVKPSNLEHNKAKCKVQHLGPVTKVHRTEGKEST